MSFSSNVKAELCKDSLSKKSCAVAEGYGVLLYCNTFSSTEIRIITESRDFAARLPRLFKKAFGITFDQEPAAPGPGASCSLPSRWKTKFREFLRRCKWTSKPV